MKITSVSIKNFRGYSDQVDIKIGDLTAFIGKNDAGKSTVLDALDIFLNDGKVEKDDVNKKKRESEDVETVIRVRFADLPVKVDLDAGNETTLKDEYLLNGNGELEIVKRYADGGKAKISIAARHPQQEGCKDLLLKKNADLKKEVEKLGLECDKTKNAEMRHAIWAHYAADLQLADIELEAEPKSGDLKQLWGNIQVYMPVYSLFRADRSNDDKDPEVQDPMKNAVKEIFKGDSELKDSMEKISKVVTERLEKLAKLTLEKLKEMNPTVANSLHPVVPQAKWEDLFKGVSISGDADIPMSKRGSGVKRLILLNFFRAEAERRQSELKSPNVVYAIEEPETSQHIDYQHRLIKALQELSGKPSVQVLLTTHSASIVKALKFGELRMVRNENLTTKIVDVPECVLPNSSLNEVSYVAFDKEATVEYHDELYGHLQTVACRDDVECYREKNFDAWLEKKGVSKDTTWIRLEKDGTPATAQPCTWPTRIRNFIHHPENHENEPRFTDEELVKSIELMRGVFKGLR